MKLFTSKYPYLSAALALLAFAPAGMAKDKKKKAPPKDPQDEITVAGHIALNGGVVRRFLATQHYSSSYLYVEHGGGNVTLVDVTKVAQPKVLADVAYAPNGDSASIFTVAGTAALVTDNHSSPPSDDPQPQTIRIMDFSDPLHPKVAREFTSVTAISRDDRRGLIFLANPEGLWILHQTFAEDPEVLKAYTWQVLYDH